MNINFLMLLNLDTPHIPSCFQISRQFILFDIRLGEVLGFRELMFQ